MTNTIILLILIVVLYLSINVNCEFWKTFRRERANSCIQVGNLGELTVVFNSPHVYTITAKLYGKKYWNVEWISFVLGMNREQYEWKVYSREDKYVNIEQKYQGNIIWNQTIASHDKAFGKDDFFLHTWIRVEKINLPVDIENATQIILELRTPTDSAIRESVNNFFIHGIYECDNWKSPQTQMEIYRVFITDAFRITYVENTLVICLGFVLFCNLLYFRNSKLVKSRRCCYYFGCISLIIYEFGDLLDSLNRAEIIGRVIQAVYMISIFFPTLTFFLMIVRYYYLKNMYSILRCYDHVMGNDMFQIHKRLVLKKVFIGIIVVVTLLFVIGVIILLCVMPSLASAQMCNLVVQVTCNFAVAFIAVIAAVLDIIYKRNMLKEKGIRYYIFSDDPLRFRFEMLFTIFLILPVGLATGLISLIRILFWTSEERVPALIVVTIFYEGLSFVFSALYMFLLSGGLIITINWFRKVIGTRYTFENEERIEIKLLDPTFALLMRDYCLNEFSIENYMLFIDLRHLKQSETVSKEVLKELSKVYFSSVSFLQVNIPGNTIQTISKHIAQMEEKNESNCAIGILDQIWLDVLVNLADTYSRLCVTAEYKQYIQVREVTRELYKVPSLVIQP
jgi:hypothetical protein